MATTAAELVCPLCTHQHLQFNLTSWLKHIKLIHSHQAGFSITCGISGCQRTFTKFRTFEGHISAIHRHQADVTNNAPALDMASGGGVELEEGDDEENDETVVEERFGSCELQQNSALFLLGLKEKHKLTQGAVQSLIDGVTCLSQQRLHSLFTQVCEVLAKAGIPLSSVSGLEALFKEDGENGRPFLGLETQYQQLKYYRTHFHFVVSAYLYMYTQQGQYCQCSTFHYRSQFVSPLGNGICGRVEVLRESAY